VISGFHHDVDDIYALLGYYAASSGNPLPAFQDNVSVPSPRAKKSMKTSRTLKMMPIRCPETSVKDYHSTLRNNPEERRFRHYALILDYFVLVCGTNVLLTSSG
jgi:hypothetical protein